MTTIMTFMSPTEISPTPTVGGAHNAYVGVALRWLAY